MCGVQCPKAKKICKKQVNFYVAFIKIGMCDWLIAMSIKPFAFAAAL